MTLNPTLHALMHRFDQAWSSPYRHTIKREAVFEGVGIHSGAVTRVVLQPASEPCGFVINQRPLREWRLSSSSWATRLTHVDLGIQLSTIEHLFAALYGAGIDDAKIDLIPVQSSGSHTTYPSATYDPTYDRAIIEAPILDGSALDYMMEIEPVLTCDMGFDRDFHILPQLKIQDDQALLISTTPSFGDMITSLTFNLTTTLVELYPELVNNAHSVMHHKKLHQPLHAQFKTSRDFVELIGPARTFGLRAHEPYLRAQGLIRGVSLDNTLIIEADGASSTPLRHPHELAAHKLLDALGDLALSGKRWRGHLEIRRGSHTLNHKLLQHLNADVAQGLI